MKRLPIALSATFLVFGMATAASAQSRCDGDFELIHGNWIATRHCQRLAAERVANRDHTHITRHTERAGGMTPDEFCRWHVGEIETETYCSSYND